MRQYLIGSWSNADSYDYSGEMLMGHRHGQSRRVHWNPDGSAAVQSYGDDEPKVKKISIKDRILPQFKRVQTLRAQMLDLEQEYKNTDMSIEEYSMLRDVIVCKIDRAEVLLKKALIAKPIRPDSYEDEGISSYASSYPPSDNNRHGGGYSSPVGVSFFAEVVDGLSDTNSFKSFLQIACKVVRKAVQLSQAARNYYNELRAL